MRDESTVPDSEDIGPRPVFDRRQEPAHRRTVASSDERQTSDVDVRASDQQVERPLQIHDQLHLLRAILWRERDGVARASRERRVERHHDRTVMSDVAADPRDVFRFPRHAVLHDEPRQPDTGHVLLRDE